MCSNNEIKAITIFRQSSLHAGLSCMYHMPTSQQQLMEWMGSFCCAGSTKDLKWINDCCDTLLRVSITNELCLGVRRTTITLVLITFLFIIISSSTQQQSADLVPNRFPFQFGWWLTNLVAQHIILGVFFRPLQVQPRILTPCPPPLHSHLSRKSDPHQPALRTIKQARKSVTMWIITIKLDVMVYLAADLNSLNGCN